MDYNVLSSTQGHLRTIQTDIQTYRHRHTEIHAYKHTDIHQRYTHTDTQTYTHIHI